MPELVASAVELAALRCRFGCEGPVGIYHVPAGCICWEDPIQALCPQHALKAQSVGPITALVSLTLTGRFTREAGRASIPVLPRRQGRGITRGVLPT